MAVPKGLWPFWTKYESALRLFSSARHAAHGRRSIDGASPPPATALLGDGHVTSMHSKQQAEGIEGNESEDGSDDEVYVALAELKASQRPWRGRERGDSRGSQRGELVGAGSRWARRIIIAGALRMMQVMLASSQ